MKNAIRLLVAVAISLGVVPGAFAFDFMPKGLTGPVKPSEQAKKEKDKAEQADSEKARAVKAAEDNRAFNKSESEKEKRAMRKYQKGIKTPGVGKPKYSGRKQIFKKDRARK